MAQRTATHAYDTAGRLSSVTADTGASATYGYLADSPLWQTLTFKQGATTRLTTTRGFDRLNRLQTIANVPGGAVSASPLGVNYLYNDANQRVRATDADGSHWVYEYDALGQVKGGRKFWADGTPVAGQQFTYAHDDIGNRTATGAGGTEAGTGLRASAYTRNRLNQYTARTVPSSVDVLGVAGSGSAVTVNNQSAYRRGEYFWQELGVANALAPVATTVTVGAGGTPTTGKLVTPPASQVFLHDLDGNLTDDGVWTYTWDAENRLVGMQHKTTLADPAARRKLAFEYDARGRRIRRQVFPWGSTDYSATATSDQRFVYDGWNLVGVFDGGLNLQTAYIWGLDLSGTAQGAGGAGGLLATITGTAAQFAAYDGNGNVRALADGTSGAWSAQYEYGPFGELIRATGPQAKANPFRFSTKWHDDETDLLYYGYRYYQPAAGRWLNRDPLGDEVFFRSYVAAKEGMAIKSLRERIEKALFAFAGNDALNGLDPFGLDFFSNVQQAAWCCINPRCCRWASNAADDVNREQQRRYGRDPDNGVINAIKHCALMCRVASGKVCSQGEARKLGNAHENTWRDNANAGMDLHNNDVGIEMSQDGMTLDQCYSACEQKALDGKLRWDVRNSPDGMTQAGQDILDFTPPTSTP